MQTEPLVSKGLRLHPALWKRIENEARRIRMRPSDYLRRQLESLFDFDPEVQKTHGSGRSEHDDLAAAFKD